MGGGSAASPLCCTFFHHTEAKMSNHESNHESCPNHWVNRFYQVGGSTNLPTDSLDSSYLVATTVVSMVALVGTKDELSMPSITSNKPECEEKADLSGHDLESLTLKPRVTFSPFARVMSITKIDFQDLHLHFYSQEDIAQFRHDKWVEDNGFDPDDLCETAAEDASTRRVSFSDNVEILTIPRIQESEWDLCFYNSDDIAEFRHEDWVEQCSTMEGEGLLFKAVSSCWKEREQDDEEMSDTSHSVSQSSIEDGDIQVVLLEDSFNNGDYQESSSGSSVSFSDDVQVKHFPKVGPSEWSDCFYNGGEIADFRHEAWVEQCASHAMESV